MKADIPVCKRCCCCLPLRYGLLAWGYFKIIADAFSILFVAYHLLDNIMITSLYGQSKHLNTALSHFVLISTLAFTTFLMDIVVTIVSIVGGHTKNAKLLRRYYRCSIAILIMTAILTISSVCLATRNCNAATDRDMALLRYCSWDILLVTCSVYIVILALQTYVLLLMRSEIIKLRSNRELRFVNNAAEAECATICEEAVVGRGD